MKGSLMTENPVPGVSPEPTPQNQEPAGAQEGSPEQPHAGRTPETAPGSPVSESPAPGNPTLRLDRAEDGAPRPVYQQNQPSQPGHPPYAQSQQTPYGQSQQTPYGQSHYGANPYGVHSGGQPQPGPSYPAGPGFANDPAHAPKRKAAFGVPT